MLIRIQMSFLALEYSKLHTSRRRGLLTRTCSKLQLRSPWVQYIGVNIIV